MKKILKIIIKMTFSDEVLWEICKHSDTSTILKLYTINRSFNSYCKLYEKQFIELLFYGAGYVNLMNYPKERLINIIRILGGVYKLSSGLITDSKTMRNYGSVIKTFMYNNVTHYNCSNSNMYSLPVMPNIRVLNCSYNKLSFIPYYKKLEVLICSNNLLYFISFGDNNSLRKIDCSNNFIKRLPRLKHCEYLECSNNFIKRLPQLDNVKHLNCSYNAISSIKGVYNAEYINCSYNKITMIYDLENIRYLYCNCNRLSCLPDMKTLEILAANFNKLLVLPKLNKVRKIHCNNNNLMYILKLSDDIEFLDVRNNRLLRFTTLDLIDKVKSEKMELLYDNTLIDLDI